MNNQINLNNYIIVSGMIVSVKEEYRKLFGFNHRIRFLYEKQGICVFQDLMKQSYYKIYISDVLNGIIIPKEEQVNISNREPCKNTDENFNKTSWNIIFLLFLLITKHPIIFIPMFLIYLIVDYRKEKK